MTLRVFGGHRGAGRPAFGVVWRWCRLSMALRDKSEGSPADQRGKKEVLIYTKAETRRTLCVQGASYSKREHGAFSSIVSPQAMGKQRALRKRVT